MTNPDHHADSLNQLLNKIDKTAENGCLYHPVSIELTDCLRKLIEMDSAEAVKQLVDRWVTWIAQDNLQPLVYDTAEQRINFCWAARCNRGGICLQGQESLVFWMFFVRLFASSTLNIRLSWHRSDARMIKPGENRPYPERS